MAAGNKFVVDSSFLLCFLLPDERDELVDEILDNYTKGKIQLIASGLFPFEVFNGINVAIYRKRISIEEAKSLGERFLKLTIPLINADYLEIQKTAQDQKITFYDATYLYLSRLYNIPLLTLDKKLQDLNLNSF